MRRIPRRAALPALLQVATAGLAGACGSGSTTGNSTGTNASAPAAQESAS